MLDQCLQIKSAHKKYKPNMVFYVDRMDVLRRQSGDLHALQMVTEAIGSSLWFNSILVLTHAGEPVPEGPQGEIGYEGFVQRRSNVLQQSVRCVAEPETYSCLAPLLLLLSKVKVPATQLL